MEDVSGFRPALKRLAREMKCPVIGVAQLSRAIGSNAPTKRAVLADLVKAASWKADGDCVMMLYRDDYYDPDPERPGEMDIIVGKKPAGEGLVR